MTAVGALGIVLSVMALPFAGIHIPGRYLMFVALLFLHIGASVGYYFYSLISPADTHLYFFDTVGMSQWDFSLGTVLLVKLVQSLKNVIGGSYFDWFLVFQSVGFWGVVILLRVFDQIHDEVNQPRSRVSYCLLFLPGVHFWTSAIGKDAPLFFAVCLALWSAMRLPRRLPFLSVAIAVMVLFRPHIALIAVVAIAMAAVFEGRFNAFVKVLLLAIALAGTMAVGSTVEATFRLNLTSAESVSDFFATRSEVSQTIEGGTSVNDAPLAFRTFSLLFRPLFYDAEGFFALVASLENLFYVFAIGFLVIHWRLSLRLAKNVFFLRFAFLFAMVLLILLSMLYYNVGLGLRQRMMMMPAVFAFFVAGWAVHGARARVRKAHVAHAPLETPA